MNSKTSIVDEFLLKGLIGMSRAISKNRMSAHPAAAMLAAYFFCVENALSTEVQAEVYDLVKRMVNSESIWFSRDGESSTNEIFFSTELDQRPNADLIPSVAAALEPSITECRDSGHNTIFASLALKALHAAPQYAFPAIIEGINDLLKAFEGRGPGWAHVPGNEKLADPREFSVAQELVDHPYESYVDMIDAVSRYVVPDNFTKRGVGGPIHIINHAVALLDLQALGYSSLAHKGMTAHQQHIELWLSLPKFPQAENRYSVKSEHDPRTSDYWREEITIKDGGGDEHRLKILYGAHRFADCITDVNKRRSFLESAAYLF